MKHKKFWIAIIIFLFLIVYASLDQKKETIATPKQAVETQILTVQEDYSDIQSLFSIVPEADVVVRPKETSLYVRIKTNLPDTQPENWEEIVSELNSALEVSQDQNTSVEFISSNGVILASGYNGKVRYIAFEEHKEYEESVENPPYITEYEFDCIQVGMSLTEVREIIGSPGELVTEIGEVSEYFNPIKTYEWYAENGYSYAHILFDGYTVYSKHEFGLK